MIHGALSAPFFLNESPIALDLIAELSSLRFREDFPA